jgi:hypothetical protein
MQEEITMFDPAHASMRHFEDERTRMDLYMPTYEP